MPASLKTDANRRQTDEIPFLSIPTPAVCMSERGDVQIDQPYDPQSLYCEMY